MAKEKDEDKETPSQEEAKDVKKDVVEVDRSTLEQILEKQKIQDELAIKQAEDIKRLTAAADIGRLDKFDQEHRGLLIRKASVATLKVDEKDVIVLGWRSTEDLVMFRSGVLEERQSAEYWLEGYDMENPSNPENKKFKVEMLQREWYQQIGRVDGDIIKETTTPDGTSTKTLRFPDGKEIEFDVVFINP